ncbi:hypothetical protein Tco_0949324 [Tanacetum coccineum]
MQTYFHHMVLDISQLPPLRIQPRSNLGNAASPNRVDTIPNNNTNNTGTNNVTLNVVVAKDLPQLLDTRGGSHVTNVPNFDIMDFSSWKDRFLLYLDGLELYLLESSTSKALIFNTCIQDNDSDVEEDTRSSSEFLADLYDEFHDRALLANQKRFYKRSGRVGSARKPMDKSNETYEGVTKVKAFMAIGKDETAIEKANVRSGQWVDITMKKKPMPPLLKLSGAKPIVKVTKKKAQTKPSSVPDPSFVKKDDSSTKQHLLTLMEEVKELKEQIRPPSENSASISQIGSSKSASKRPGLNLDYLKRSVWYLDSGCSRLRVSITLLLFDDEMVQESNKDDVLNIGEEMDEDIPPTDEEAQSPHQIKNNLNHLMHKNSLMNQILTPLACSNFWNKHKEAVACYANLSKAGIDERAKLLKALNRVSKILESDSVLKEEMKKMAESYTTTCGNLLGITKLINNAYLPELLTKTEGFQSTLNTLSTQPPLTDPILKIHVPQQTTLVIDITPPEPQVTQREGMGIATKEQLEPSSKKLVPASREFHQDLDEPIIAPCDIHGKIYQLKNDEIQAHLDKKEEIKKKAEEARLLEMTKSELIKVVHEEAEKARIDPKIILSAKGGEQFKKIQDAEHQILNQEYLNKEEDIKKKAEEARLLAMTKSEIIKVVHEEVEKAGIDPNIVLSVKGGEQFKRIQDAEHQVHKRANDRINFQVHNPIKFTDFRVTKLDELGLIIQKKKNKIVGELMTSLGKRYEHLKKITEELGIQSALPAPKQAQS